NNKIKGAGGVEVNDKKGLIITGQQFEYNKLNSILVVNDNVVIKDDLNNNLIKTEKITFNKTSNIINTNNKTIIKLDSGYLIESSSLIYDRNLNVITSENKTFVTDPYENKLTMRAFQYSTINRMLSAQDVEIIDIEKNYYNIKNIKYDFRNNEIIGQDLSLEFNGGNIKTDQNQPRLKGKTIFYKKDTTKVKQGVFTTCKKDDDCPPWVLSASKIEHNKVKKTVNYENALLKIYDVPVFYFPKFFHPDPTVKRQSGFLVPTFSQSNNLGNYISIPYFNAISNSSDLTFTPRFYDKGKTIYQTEYRKHNKNSKHMLDFSIKNKSIQIFDDNKKKSSTHFFSKSSFDLDLDNNFTGELDIKVQQTSDDDYLKTYKLKSPLIESESNLNTSLNFNLYNDDLSVKITSEAYENLSLPDSDRYEFIYPSINIIKEFDYFDNGSFSLSSAILNKQYQTNIKESTITNDLNYKSYKKISSNGLLSSYEVLIKNFNSDANNSSKFSNKNSSSLAAITNYELKYPLKKNINNYTSTITPIISARYSPNDTKNRSQDDRIINYDNIFSINRIGLGDSVEGGQSITMGTEYSLTNKNNKRNISASLATVYRDKENKNLPLNSTLGKKNSDIFGNIEFNNDGFIDFDYGFALDNNLKTINYNQIKSTLSFYKFVSEFDFLEKKGINSESYIANETKFTLNESSSIGFRTRRNKEKNLTEYYNLLYEYQNDCLIAGIEYTKDYYSDGSLKPEELLFFSVTIMPFGTIDSPGIN
ncbi:MAG: LPS-assembly protein LptD, partial [Cryomorphaceae bacterium]|nr:LPS-assembly protein LptD [Cryomorphaceae bacterium]